MGYKLAGYEMQGANDIDPQMAANYQPNLHPKHYVLGGVRDLLTANLPERWYQLDILDGSPPCSTFSTTAVKREKTWGQNKMFREGQAKQVLSDLFFDFLDVAAHLRPKVIVAENVTGLIKGRAIGYAKLIMARLKEIGYRPQLFQVNGADCGVPQRRERVFFVALRNDISAPPLILAPAKPWVTAATAIADLELTAEERVGTAMGYSHQKLWPLLRPGESGSQALLRAGLPSSFFSHIKLTPNRPASTVTATAAASLLHWDEPRVFCARELARFSAFPEDYQPTSNTLYSYLCGMSVPPYMTAHVARAIARQWLDRDIPDDELTEQFW